MKLENNYIYRITMAEIERSVIKFPKFAALTKSEEDVRKNNKKLCNYDAKMKNLNIWITPFQHYHQIILSDIITSKKLRNFLKKEAVALDVYIWQLYEEYVAWLNYISQNNVVMPVKPLKKHFLSFFSNYNKMYYLDTYKQKCLRRYDYNLNPLIKYWFDCQPLTKVLKIHGFPIFLPNIGYLWQTLTKNNKL